MVISRGLGDIAPYGQLCQPACSVGGTLCPDPTSFGSSLNPCCSQNYAQVQGDGYCGGGGVISPTVDALFGAGTNALTNSPMTMVIFGAVILGALFILKK